MGSNWSFVCINIYCVGAGLSTLMSNSELWWIRLVHFESKNEKNAAYEARNGWKGVYFPPESAFFVFMVYMIKTLFPICTLTWRVNNYVCRWGRGINNRNENAVSKWFLYTAVQTTLNDFVRLNWLLLIGNYSFMKRETTFPLCSRIALKIQISQSSPLVNLFLKMATLRNERKLAAVSREAQKYPRNSHSQNTSAPEISEGYLAQVSEKIKRRVTKKLSHEFSRTESRILGALSMLDEFFRNPQVRTFSGTVPGTFRNAEIENQGPNGDRSQNDPHPEVEFSACRASNLTDSDPDETSHRIVNWQSGT